MMDLRAAIVRIRPWCLRAAALLRLGVLAVSGPALVREGALGISIAVWLCVSAVGLWWRRVLFWRGALLVDIAIVVGGAIVLLEASDLQLFSTIAATVVIDVALLGFGQAALELPPPPQGPPASPA